MLLTIPISTASLTEISSKCAQPCPTDGAEITKTSDHPQTLAAGKWPPEDDGGEDVEAANDEWQPRNHQRAGQQAEQPSSQGSADQDSSQQGPTGGSPNHHFSHSADEDI